MVLSHPRVYDASTLLRAAIAHPSAKALHAVDSLVLIFTRVSQTSTMLSVASNLHLSFAGPSPSLHAAVRAPAVTMQGGFDVRAMPGVSAPLGFFDPLGFCDGASEGKIKFYREVEIKHGRLAMLASLGFVVGESFHPLWGGKIDVPSYIAFQETPLQQFWPAVVFLISVAEIFSVFTFNSPFGGEMWSIRSDYANGDLGFDPLGLKPNTPADLKDMQTREINNGRTQTAIQLGTSLVADCSCGLLIAAAIFRRLTPHAST